MSYTTFAYSNLRLDKETVTDSDVLHVSVDVTNTGTVAGKEIVQLYVRDLTESTDRPVKELKGFEKVTLEPGETKTVTMQLDYRSFAWYSTSLGDWYAAGGRYEILVGASSRDIRLSASITLQTARVLPLHVHKNTTLGELCRNPRTKEIAAQLANKILAGMGVGASEAASEAISDEMNTAMIDSMPLRALRSFTGMNGEEIEDIIKQFQAAADKNA